MSFYDYYHIIMLLKYMEIFPEKYPGKFRKFSGKIWNFPDNFSASQHYCWLLLTGKNLSTIIFQHF